MAHDEVAQVISSNTPPNPDEILTIQKRILYLASATSKAQEHLQELEDEQKQYQASLSAIRRVPVEVLGEVFLCVSPDRPDLVKLQLVCKKWREAALLSHQLWDSIHIWNPSRLVPNTYPKIATWLRRSGNVSRTLNISEDYHRSCKDGSKHCVFQNPTILKLLMLGPAIHELVLSEMKGHGCFQNLVRLMGTPLEEGPCFRPWDGVQSLHLGFSDAGSWAAAGHRETLFANLPPSITSLAILLPEAIDAFPDPSDSNDVNLQVRPSLLKRLTNLTITCDWQGAHIMHMLQHCENLVSLELNLLYAGLTFGSQDASLQQRISTSAIVLPKLKTLKLQRHPDLLYLKYLTAPELSALDIGFTGADERSGLPEDHDIYTRLHDFIIARSKRGESLHTLRIYDTRFSASELASILADLPALTHLELDRIAVSWEELFEALRNRAKPPKPEKGSTQRPKPCLAYLETLKLLQLELPSEISLEPAFRFLHGRGPRPCQFVVSFIDSSPKPPDRRDTWDYWGSAIRVNSMGGGGGDNDRVTVEPTMEGYGIQFSIEPADGHGDY